MNALGLPRCATGCYGAHCGISNDERFGCPVVLWSAIVSALGYNYECFGVAQV